MRLVVLVPLVAHLHAVEVARLPWFVAARPLGPRGCEFLLGREDFLALFHSARNLALVQGHGSLRVVFLFHRCKSRCTGGDGLAGQRRAPTGTALLRPILHGHIAQLANLAPLVGQVVQESILLGLRNVLVFSAQFQ